MRQLRSSTHQPMMRPHPNWYDPFLWLISEHSASVNGKGRSFFSMTDLTR